MLLAIQGQHGSFHHIAAQNFFGEEVVILPCDSFEECFETLEKSHADKAMIAIENSLYGSINPVYDQLLKYRFFMAGEVYLHIEQCLIGMPEAKLSDITHVHSQIMALVQSEDFLDKNLPEATRIEEHDTTASVKFVKDKDEKFRAAIASRQAAELLNMKVLARGIETNKQNYTRFMVFDKSPYPGKADKTSLVLHLPSDTKPGVLYRALGTFASRNINLVLLHSRPIKSKAWHYNFYIDVAEDSKSEKFQEAIKELEIQGCDVHILGSYESGNNKH